MLRNMFRIAAELIKPEHGENVGFLRRSFSRAVNNGLENNNRALADKLYALADLSVTRPEKTNDILREAQEICLDINRNTGAIGGRVELGYHTCRALLKITEHSGDIPLQLRTSALGLLSDSVRNAVQLREADPAYQPSVDPVAFERFLHFLPGIYQSSAPNRPGLEQFMFASMNWVTAYSELTTARVPGTLDICLHQLALTAHERADRPTLICINRMDEAWYDEPPRMPDNFGVTAPGHLLRTPTAFMTGRLVDTTERDEQTRRQDAQMDSIARRANDAVEQLRRLVNPQPPRR